MKEFLSILFTVVFSYLIGSINSAITVCRILKKKDIRDYGSGNAGLTNVLRVFGKGPALATLLADLAKGVIAVVICRVVVTYGFDIVFFENKLYIGYIAGLAVMLGHIFPVFYGFHDIRTDEDIDKLEFPGGGGTDFDVAADAFTMRADNRIVFTDGEADEPGRILDAIWVIYGDEKLEPPGGTVIHIPDFYPFNRSRTAI